MVSLSCPRFSFLLHPQDQAQSYWNDDLAVIRSGKPKLHFEEPWETVEGQRWMSTSKIPLSDEQGNIIGIIGFSTDITKRKKAEESLKEYSEKLEKTLEELRETQEELISKQKLAIIGQLAGGVGHDLRNPLGAIKNAVYFLKMVIEDPEPELKEIWRSWRRKSQHPKRLSIASLTLLVKNFPPGRMSK